MNWIERILKVFEKDEEKVKIAPFSNIVGADIKFDKGLSFRIRNALKEYKELCEYGCLKISCGKCQYLVRLDKYRSTCERERLVKILLPKYEKQVDEIDAEFYK